MSADVFFCSVYVEDTDCYGFVYHANYIKFCERARNEWLKARGLSLSTLKKSAYHFVVASLQCDFLKPARLDDNLTIHTQLKRQRLSLAIFEQSIQNAKGDTLFNASVKVVCVNAALKLISFPLIAP